MSGNGNHGTWSGTAPTWTAAGLSIAAAAGVLLPDFEISGTNWTLAFVGTVANSDTAQDQHLFYGQSSGSDELSFGNSFTAPRLTISGTVNINPFNTIIIGAGYHAVAAQRAGSTYAVRYDAQSTTGTSGTPPDELTLFSLCSHAAKPYTGTMCAAVVMPSTISDADFTLLRDYYRVELARVGVSLA